MQNKRVLGLLLGSSSVMYVKAASPCTQTAINLVDGSCFECQAGTSPDANGVICVPIGFCQAAANQINKPDGKCVECNPCYEPNSNFDDC